MDDLHQPSAERFDAGAGDVHVVDLDVGARAETGRRLAGTCGLERHERPTPVGRELDPVGLGFDDPDSEHALPELRQAGRIRRVHDHRPQPTHRIAHAHCLPLDTVTRDGIGGSTLSRP